MFNTRETRPLNWIGPAAYPGLTAISVTGDGSCYFHAIAKAFFTPYRTGIINGVPIDRRTLVRNFRWELAAKLASPSDPSDPESKLVYDTLSGGNLREFANFEPQYSLENMIHELRSGGPVDYVYQELISNEIDKDIYILNLREQDVINLSNNDIFYKNRKAIVLLYMPGHYELVGIQDEDNVIRTLFSSDDDYILHLRSRLQNFTH